MSVQRRQQYDEEFKKNAVKLSHASPKSVKDTADDLGSVGESQTRKKGNHSR